MLLGVALLLSCAPAHAAGYGFTKIADTAAESPYDSLMMFPAVNGDGVVAFGATQKVADPGQFGPSVVVLSDGATTTTVLDSDTTGIDPFTFHGLSVNAGLTAAFTGFYTDPQDDTVNYSGIFTASTAGTGVRATDETGTGFTGFFPIGCSINDSNSVLFIAFLDGSKVGLFLSRPGQAPIKIADAEGPLSFLGRAALANGDVVAWVVDEFAQTGVGANGQPVYARTQARLWRATIDNQGQFTPQLVADRDGIVDTFHDVAVNSSGHVLFSALLDSGERGVFLDSDAGLVIDTSGPFEGFMGIGLNASGKAVVGGILDPVGADPAVRGIFTGPDPVADKVVATGDILDGMRVGSVEFSGEALGDGGQVVFQCILENPADPLTTKYAIFRADPAGSLASLPLLLME